MRYYYLTASIMTAILLSACAEGPQNEVGTISTPELSTSETEPQKNTVVQTRSATTGITNIDGRQPAGLSKRFEGLDPKDISRAEIDELIELQEEQKQISQAFKKDLQTWYQQDPALRGQQPQMVSSPRLEEVNERLQDLNTKVHIANQRKRYKDLDPKYVSEAEIEELIALQKEQYQINLEYQKEMKAGHQQGTAFRGAQSYINQSPRAMEINERLQELTNKVHIANLRKRYEKLDSNVISKEEVEELIALQQEQMKFYADNQKEMQAWSIQNPNTKGAQPGINHPRMLEVNIRMQELQGKIRSANQIKSLRERMQKLSITHNVALSDSEIEQLTQLETEKQKTQNKLSMAFMEAQKNGQPFNQASIINAVPKHVLQSMYEVDQRIKAIRAPLDMAEKAERIRKNMTQLSEQSGVPVLSNEIEEAIALNAEKDRIQTRAQTEAYNKWMSEGGSITNAQYPLPNDADYARLKEIEARIKAISAPMNEAKNAALEANNPALRQHRLEREKRQKWTEDWQDRKQAGEIPPNAQMNSPSYAELQDRVKNYRSKLKTRADQAGYSVSEADVTRLEALNEEMVAIRKKVYNMEIDGTSMALHENGSMTPSFALTSGMRKIQMITQKQQEILADLSKAEASQFSAGQYGGGQIGTQRYDHGIEVMRARTGSFGQGVGAEFFIESFRKRGVEISPSEADELLAFERALKDK